MVNPNDPAFSKSMKLDINGQVQDIGPDGLTKREHFACELTKGLISSGVEHINGLGDPELFARLGCRYADALIAELNKEVQP